MVLLSTNLLLGFFVLWNDHTKLKKRFCIAIVGATFALVQQVLVRARMRRELFYWTQKLQCKMRELEQEVNPFNLSTLKRWLDRCVIFTMVLSLLLLLICVDGDGLRLWW